MLRPLRGGGWSKPQQGHREAYSVSQLKRSFRACSVTADQRQLINYLTGFSSVTRAGILDRLVRGTNRCGLAVECSPHSATPAIESKADKKQKTYVNCNTRLKGEKGSMVVL